MEMLLPKDAKPSKNPCKKCGGEIYWYHLDNDKWMPVDKTDKVIGEDVVVTEHACKEKKADEVDVFTREDLNKLKVTSLRRMAREKYKGADKSVISYIGKDKLIDLILTGEIPEQEPKPEKGEIEQELEKRAEADMLEQKPTPEPQKSNGDGLADMLAKALDGKIKAGLDEEGVKRIVKSMISTAPKVIEIKKLGKPNIPVGRQHKAFPNILKLASIRYDVFLVGAAGSGKTFACEAVAKALELPFYFIPVGRQTSKTDLLGYKDANGNYIPTLLREAYENGGVFLMDEIDAGNPNVLTIINAMLSNSVASFPDKMVKRHPDFVFIAAGNTYGHGGDIQYVGRNQIDAATLDRFTLIKFDYDLNLEKTFTDNEEWFEIIKSVREAVNKLNEKVIVSPRATIKGAQMIKLGFSESECLDMLVYRGISKDIKSRIESERVGV